MLEKKWVKYGVVGSVIWAVLVFLVSADGLGLLDTSYDDFDEVFPSGIVGCIAIWVVCYFIIRGKGE